MTAGVHRFADVDTLIGSPEAVWWRRFEANCSLFSTLDWLRMREGELPDGTETHYLVASSADGESAIGLTAYQFHAPPHPLYRPSFVFAGILDGGTLSQLDREPLVVAAGYSEFFGELLVAGAAPEALLQLLGTDVLDLADGSGSTHIAFDFVAADDVARVVDMFSPEQCLVAFHDVEANVIVDYPSVEGYLASMGKVSRKTARREMRAFEAGGKLVDEYRLSEVADTIAPLNSELMVKYGHNYTPARSAAVFRRQARYLDARSSVLVVRAGEELTGFVLRYRHRDELWSRVAGFRYEAGNRDYFALHHDEVRRAAVEGLSAIHLGQGTLEAKLSRGATPRPLYCVLVRREGWSSADRQRSRAISESRLEALRIKFGTSGRKAIDGVAWAQPTAWPVGAS